MAQIINRDGQEFTFPDNYTQEQIDAYFNNLENSNQSQEETPKEEEIGHHQEKGLGPQREKEPQDAKALPVDPLLHQ